MAPLAERSWLVLFLALAAAALLLKAVQEAASQAGGKRALLTARMTRETTGAAGSVRLFHRNWLLVYGLAIASDWVQGPYVYALYDSYGFRKQAIAWLYIIGFASSLVLGTFVGALADRFGRKRLCLAYGLVYSLSCFTKHSQSFAYLALGRVLGGTATSLLLSVFESWLVHEHNRRGYSSASLASVFAEAAFVNGVVAILASLAGNAVVHGLGYPLVTPFDMAVITLVAGAVLVAATWTENYGVAVESSDSEQQLAKPLTPPSTPTAGAAGGGSGDAAARPSGTSIGLVVAACRALVNDQRMLLLGSMQSLFEGSMYTFTFVWTPTLEHSAAAAAAPAAATSMSPPPGLLLVGELSAEDIITPDKTASAAGDDASIPHGLVFACFMVCVMAGSSIVALLQGRWGGGGGGSGGDDRDDGAQLQNAESLLRITFAVSAVSLAIPCVTSDKNAIVTGFLVFELCVGLYFPLIARLRSHYIPEAYRSTIMNLFRVPLNAMVVLVLFRAGQISDQTIYAFCAIWLALAAVATHFLSQLAKGRAPIAAHGAVDESRVH